MNLLTVKSFAHCRWLILLGTYGLMSFHASAAAQEPSNVCWQQANRAELNRCLELQLAELEQQQQALLLQLKQQAAELETISEGAADLGLALTQASDDFVRFRQSQCNWEMKMMASGSGAGSQYLLCKIKLTENSLSRLQQWLKPSH
ncbi:lysozyme inhibitor LprI family protein [Agarivorans sp.]|uniref:lysozyme inhibitor LprI family protein n=1 Tax=Agarivorans sp. TaxID=1872412 RepID=UPI003D08A250